MNDTPQASETRQSAIAGWTGFVDSLHALPGQLLAKLPEEEREDPQILAEVGRLMLSALTVSTLTALNGDGDHPAFVPSFGQAINLARPNADTIYRVAEITPGGTYRLRGRRGTLAMVRIGEGGGKGPDSVVYHDLNTLQIDSAGRYDVILSAERPAGHVGDWWRIRADTTRLLVRMISNDWRLEEDPTFAIERIDRPAERPRVPAAELEQRLLALPRSICAMAGLRMGWISQLRAQGFLHKPNMMNYAEAGLLAGQFYYEAAFDLADDEALLIEAEEPEICGYRSIILTTEMGETIDWTNNHSSLNGSQAMADRDGIVRVIVSPRDPGVPNWLDTAGYRQGGIQGRWTDCSAQPLPVLRKIRIDEVRDCVPSETPVVTPEERQAIIRERRAAFQERPLW